jgi:DNA invertase Pin-like site-specific DNA recombinase
MHVALNPRTPAAAYLRRSTDRQEQSIPDQRNEIRRWAAEHGYDIIREYIDDAVSGTSADKRPAFQQMIADAQHGLFKAVIVWNSDRFSRGDVTETEHYRYVLRKAGATLLSVTEDYLAREGIDGDVLRTVKQFQNRQYSISLSQNTLRGQISSVLAASDPGRLTPVRLRPRDRRARRVAALPRALPRVRRSPGVRPRRQADGDVPEGPVAEEARQRVPRAARAEHARARRRRPRRLPHVR